MGCVSGGCAIKLMGGLCKDVKLAGGGCVINGATTSI